MSNPLPQQRVNYSERVARDLCQHIAEGKSLRQIEKIDGMPGTSTIMRWLADPRRDGFRAKYALAKQVQMERLAEEALAISDDPEGDLARDKLRVDTRKWLITQLAPKRYGEAVLAPAEPGAGPVSDVLRVEIIRHSPAPSVAQDEMIDLFDVETACDPDPPDTGECD